MLIVLLIILATAPLLTARPYGPPSIVDIIPGITFIEPEFYRSVFGYYQTILEGSFWSLFVEVKFYIVAGLLYFWLGTKKMIGVIAVMFLSSILLEFLIPFLPIKLAVNLKLIMHFLNWGHYGWFAAGALFYEYFTTKNWRFWLAGVLVALLAARCLGGFLSVSMIIATILVLLVALAMVNQRVQMILSNQYLVLVGFVSYPLYLLHENAMVSMINQLHSAEFGLPNYLLPIIALIPIFIIAWFISQYVEPMLRRSIKVGVKKIKPVYA